MSQVELAEMRKFCDETTVRPIGANRDKGSTFRNAPDWAVRRVYEIRNGLTLTPLPAEAYKNLVSSEEEKLRLQARALLGMQQ